MPAEVKLVRLKLRPNVLTLRGVVAMVFVSAAAILLSGFSAVAAIRVLESLPELGNVSYGSTAMVALLLAFGGTFYASYYLLHTRVDVGIDGVRVSRVVSRAYHRLADISGVRVESDVPLPDWDVVRLVLSDGGEVRLVFPPGATRGSAIEGAVTPLLGAVSTEWPVQLAELREAPEASSQRLIAGRSGSAYRSKTVSRKTWWQLLDAPGVAPEMRVAAAIGLGPDVFRGERSRVRSLLKRLALPRLRTLVCRGFKSRTAREAGVVLEQASRL